ncbi:hypothetical protein BH24GEM2_BH24GEM2_04450 [soil metagenome]
MLALGIPVSLNPKWDRLERRGVRLPLHRHLWCEAYVLGQTNSGLSPYRNREVRAAPASRPDADKCTRSAQPDRKKQLCRSSHQHASGLGEYTCGEPHSGTK